MEQEQSPCVQNLKCGEFNPCGDYFNDVKYLPPITGNTCEFAFDFINTAPPDVVPFCACTIIRLKGCPDTWRKLKDQLNILFP